MIVVAGSCIILNFLLSTIILLAKYTAFKGAVVTRQQLQADVVERAVVQPWKVTCLLLAV
jgi:hypothetical protein